MLNPQAIDTIGMSTAELTEVVANMYAHGMEHLESGTSGDTPTVAFGNADRTILVAFSGIGNARDLPEGMPAGHSISGYINPSLLLVDAGQSQEQRLATLKRLIDRPLNQLRVASGI